MALKIAGAKPMIPSMDTADQRKFERVENALMRVMSELDTAMLLTRDISGNNMNGWTEQVSDLYRRTQALRKQMYQIRTR